MKYCERLKELRIKNGKTQEDMAAILNIDRTTYNHYEVLENVLPIRHINTICNYFDVSIDYLLGLSNKKQYPNANKEIDKIKAGQRLKEFRKENKIVRQELAELLNTTFSNIAWYEKGRNLISTSFLYTICSKYNVSADYLLGKID